MEYKGSIWTAILTLLVGVALIFMRNMVTTTIVIVLGALFAATGILNIIMQFSRRDSNGRHRTSFSSLLTSLAAAVLGVWMICDPSGNLRLVITLLGIMAILGGGYHIFNMLVTFRHIKFPAWFYIMPALIAGCGIYMVCSPQTFAESLVLIAGIVLILYSVATMIEMTAISSADRQLKSDERKAAADADTETPFVEDVDAREADSHGNAHWPSDRR